MEELYTLLDRGKGMKRAEKRKTLLVELLDRPPILGQHRASDFQIHLEDDEFILIVRELMARGLVSAKISQSVVTGETAIHSLLLTTKGKQEVSGDEPRRAHTEKKVVSPEWRKVVHDNSSVTQTAHEKWVESGDKSNTGPAIYVLSVVVIAFLIYMIV